MCQQLNIVYVTVVNIKLLFKFSSKMKKKTSNTKSERDHFPIQKCYIKQCNGKGCATNHYEKRVARIRRSDKSGSICKMFHSHWKVENFFIKHALLMCFPSNDILCFNFPFIWKFAIVDLRSLHFFCEHALISTYSFAHCRYWTNSQYCFYWTNSQKK